MAEQQVVFRPTDERYKHFSKAEALAEDRD